MQWKMPTVIYEEKDCVRNHAEDLAAFGAKAMIVTGRNSAKKNGSYEDVTAALEEAGVAYILFDEVEENPSIETIMKAREVGIADQVDFVIGIGGGSPMDAAKAIALMIANPKKDENFFDEKAEHPDALPVVAVPTTCGTGSEVTGVAVLTRHAKRTKASMVHKIYPALALVDAKYLASAPQSVICNTAVDALAHLIESWLNRNATDYSRVFVREGLRVWALEKDVLTGVRKAEYEDYRNLMNASTYAGMAIAHTGTSIPHALSYMVTYELGMAHGKACGYFLPGFVKEAPEEDRSYLLSATGFEDVDQFADFLHQVCRFPEVPQDVLERTVSGLASNDAKRKTASYPVDEDGLRRMLYY